MRAEPLIVRPAARAQPLSVLGTSVTILADSSQTGALGVTFQQGAAGTGPGPHCHPWEEAFFVTEGSVEFTVEDQTDLLEAGSLVVVPRETVHAFRYGPSGGRMLEVTGPGSNAAGMFRTFAEEMTGEPDVPQAAEIMARHGARLLV